MKTRNCPHEEDEGDGMDMPVMQPQPIPGPNRRFAFFMDEVNHTTVKPICEWIFANNFDNSPARPHELILIINSEGGNMNDAMALIDMIQGSKIPVRTVGLGMIASAGLLIFMAGAKGTRTLTPNTSILSHQWSWAAVGKQHELVAREKEFTLIQKRMIRHYMKCTGLSEKKVLDLLLAPSDQWLDDKEALQLGLCDQIQEMGVFIPGDTPAKKTRKKRGA